MANVAKLIAYLQSLLPPMPPGNMPPPDPRLAIAQMNQQIDQQRLKQEAEEAFAALQLKQQEMQNKAAERQIRMQEQANREMADLQKEQMRQAAEDRRTAAEIESRERMNLSDNQTALTLAEAEIRSGERFAVSTGTGINPQP
jgi:hypothetical protein